MTATPRKRQPRIKPTEVRTVWTDDNTFAARISLHGEHGKGRWMILDRKDWDKASKLHGDTWTLSPRPGDGAADAFAITPGREPTDSNIVVLSEWLAKSAGVSPPLQYRNASPLDLRRSNIAPAVAA